MAGKKPRQMAFEDSDEEDTKVVSPPVSRPLPPANLPPPISQPPPKKEEDDLFSGAAT
jgi:hypothetical protein